MKRALRLQTDVTTCPVTARLASPLAGEQGEFRYLQTMHWKDSSRGPREGWPEVRSTEQTRKPLPFWRKMMTCSRMARRMRDHLQDRTIQCSIATVNGGRARHREGLWPRGSSG